MIGYWQNTTGIIYPDDRVGLAQRQAFTPVVVINPKDDVWLDQVYVALINHGWTPPPVQTRLRHVFESLIGEPRAEVPEGGWGRNATVRDRAGHEWRHNAWTGRWYALTSADQQSSAAVRDWADLDVAPGGVLWEGAR